VIHLDARVEPGHDDSMSVNWLSITRSPAVIAQEAFSEG